ncbi:hypothetical protein QE152_g36284 [Popillia japonica]|uniref:Uncharacterized protein n=1 Tax=Popillia japonica TaxID=7064 RepID=A0AAW1IDQ8_POPJA
MVAPGQSLIQDQAQVPAGGTPRQNQSINGNVGRCRPYAIRKAHGGALLPADLQSPTRHPLENRVRKAHGGALLPADLQSPTRHPLENRVNSSLQTATEDDLAPTDCVHRRVVRIYRQITPWLDG